MSNIKDNYIVLDMMKVNQLSSGIFFAGKMKFSELNQVFRLTERKEKIDDNVFGGIDVKEYKDNEDFFQRQISQQKIKSIKQYLENSLERGNIALFPSPIILYNKAYENDDLHTDVEVVEESDLTKEVVIQSYREDLDCCFYIPDCDNKDSYKIYIPKNENITLVVDGQHRFVGTQSLYNSLPDGKRKQKIADFEFIVTYLVGFDIYEVGKIFADVNFTQKPVNRSLYYDIFGSAPQTDKDGDIENEIRLAHDLAVHLNNNAQSPINGMIKLLGKGYGLFSQAFFVDKIRNHVFRSKIWNEYIIDYLNGGDEYKVIAKFMKSYFNALKKAYPSSWPEKVSRNCGKEKEVIEVYSSYDYKHILCKTNGLGAYLRLIKNIYPLVKESPNDFENQIYKIFSKISDEDAKNNFFSKNSKYGNSAGESKQKQLYDELLIKYDLKSQKTLPLDFELPNIEQGKTQSET